MRSARPLSGRHQSVGDRHRRLPDAPPLAVAQRRLRLREAVQVEHLAQLQLHGSAARLRECARRWPSVFVREERAVALHCLRHRHEDILHVSRHLQGGLGRAVAVGVIGVVHVLVLVVDVVVVVRVPVRHSANAILKRRRSIVGSFRSPTPTGGGAVWSGRRRLRRIDSHQAIGCTYVGVQRTVFARNLYQ